MDRFQPEQSRSQKVEEKKATEPLSSRAGKMSLNGAAAKVAEKISDPVILGANNPVKVGVDAQLSGQKDQQVLNQVTTAIREALTHPLASRRANQRLDQDIQKLDQIQEQRKKIGIQTVRIQQEMERQQTKSQGGQTQTELKLRQDPELRRTATQTPATASRAVQDAVRTRVLRNNTDTAQQQNAVRESAETAAKQSALSERNSSKEQEIQATKDLVINTADTAKPTLVVPPIGEVIRIEVAPERKIESPPVARETPVTAQDTFVARELLFGVEQASGSHKHQREEMERERIRIQQQSLRTKHFDPVASEEEELEEDRLERKRKVRKKLSSAARRRLLQRLRKHRLKMKQLRKTGRRARIKRS
jgi:hypothetical protein